MVTYAKEEMVGITELGKSLGSYLDKVTSNTFNKLAIIRRNKPEAVIVPIEEYEYMRASADILEDMQIAQVIKERVLDKKEPIETLSFEELIVDLKQRGLDV
ncbi:MAG: type II toxin-antitoxin system Phd/YefM family antitoxin [Campylobacterota bacterium]|nr:type II toxin-antitoxin system Phd/YefM family antitoxin [Campylobacterota bacterium]